MASLAFLDSTSISRYFLYNLSICCYLKCVEMNSCWFSDYLGKVVGVGGIITMPAVRSALSAGVCPPFL